MANTVANINRIKRPGMVDDARKFLRAELDGLRDNGGPCRAVIECRAEQLDQDMHYIGAANGVVELHTGKLLARSDGRRALVTASTPVPFDPAAKHTDVDRLFAHLLAA